ncbi:hypothetical protein ORIO_20590 (plasmid) [Cereibacter azotoformans]|uniref:hypothetical protein n=1 Tax=Cereibacter azotoformans TaxID=43057 RepID=UPI001EEBFAD7|nr:hypothetical protein [Cereibacter azotoformans]ULB12199.1 hypothetical protein ORIO_20590 [Cereibacter azotoformans]
MKNRIVLPAWIAIGLLASSGAALADPSGPATSGVRLVIVGQGTIGSDFSMTGLNFVAGAGEGGTAFETNMEGLQWECDDADCRSRSASYEDANWSVIQTVRACSQTADCSFSSDVGLLGQD